MSRALGRYELLRPLARGGMAEVYLARRRAAGVEKWLVVKRIRAAFATDVRFLDLFMREARLSMSLAHQNIVPVFDFGRIDDQVFLAMERVEGKDLGSSLERANGKRLPPLLAAFVASECCQALDYAHHRKSPEGTALGIVHRDVTPRNVLLSWSGEVKLTDFGIAALAGDAHTKLLGTPAYMAPEQARAEPIDARTDIYAVGLILREMLTGERARPGTDRTSMHDAACSGTLVRWATGVPPAIMAIVDRATALSPDDRYPDARSMLAELDDFMVAERAANKSEAPARGLAAWIAELWAGERDDRGIEGDVDGEHLHSFLDDGALDAVGTGTQRSMLATAGEEQAAPAAKKERATALAATDVATSSTGNAAGDGALVSGRPRAQRPTIDPDASTDPIGRSSRLPWIVFAVVSLGGVAAILGVTLGGATKPAQIAEAPAMIDAPLPDAAPVIVVDAAPAMVLDAAPVIAVDAAPTRPTQIKVSPPVVPDKPTVVLRNAQINATPWANFTVEGDATVYETPKTLQLAPGKYRIHFMNPVLEVERTITIEVPEDRDLKHVEKLGN